jgi:DNA-binding MarR family transcriptional regulator
MPLGSQPLFDAHVPSAEALRALEAHPRFSAALRIIAAGGVAQYRGNRILNMMITDRARFLIGVFAIHLHDLSRPGDPRSGLTLSRIKAICVEQKICSAGRAEAMLVLMRMLGYLASARSEEDRRLHRLVPTDALIAWHRERLSFTLEAVANLLPEGAQALAALRSPDFSPNFLVRFVSHVARLYLTGFYYVDHVPEMKLFFERNAGVVILFSIMLSGETTDGFPPRGPVLIFPARLARQFGVSRSHVRRMVQEAINAGLLERDETRPDCYRVLPALHAAFSRITALYILHNAHAARAALAEIEPRSEVA